MSDVLPFSPDASEGPERAEVVFSTADTSTLNAREFATLILNISNAASATAKATAAEAGALGSCGRPLIIRPTAGGFSLAAAPRPKRPHDIELDFAVRDIDDAALCSVIHTLFDEDAHLDALPHSAQQPLANAAKVMTKKRHHLSVTVRQRGIDTREYSGNPNHAADLVTEFATEKLTTTTIDGVFLFDGFKDSSDTIFLMIDGTSHAVIAEDVLVKQVAGFLSTTITRPLQLECTIEESTLIKPGRKPVIHRRLLTAEPHQQTDIGEQFALVF